MLLSLRFPVPKLRTLRKTPLLAFASIRRTVLLIRHADVEVAVGGDDDAVGPFGMKFATAWS
jgi:hypothetical protein